MRFKWSITLFLLAVFAVNNFAQKIDNQNKKKIDGIAAVIGNQIVLQSDIDRDFLTSKAQGYQVSDKCQFLNDIMMEKMLVDRARKDTLIRITQDEVTRALNNQIQDFVDRAGNEEAILSFFGFKTMAELKNEMKYIIEDNLYSSEKRRMIVQGTDATPEEVRIFFEKYKNELPDVKEEVSLSHIVLFPEISLENENKIISQLKDIKKEIEEGASFATKAILYSEDTGSGNNGGLINKITRGKMVKEFEAVVYNLEEGQISEPFKSQFGYHIAKLEKRRGQELDVRHILISLKPDENEIKKGIEKLDSIKILINEGKITFKDAALRFSDDKYTKYNAGVLSNMKTGDDRFEKINLPVNEFSAITSLEEGNISNVFQDDYENRKAVRILKLDKIFPEHKINFEDDYYRIKQAAIREKEKRILIDWVKTQIPDSFIKIGNDYQSCKFEIDWERK